jgi:hypothetical protein
VQDGIESQKPGDIDSLDTEVRTHIGSLIVEVSVPALRRVVIMYFVTVLIFLLCPFRNCRCKSVYACVCMSEYV